MYLWGYANPELATVSFFSHRQGHEFTVGLHIGHHLADDFCDAYESRFGCLGQPA